MDTTASSHSESSVDSANATAAPRVIPSLQRWTAQTGTTSLAGGIAVEHSPELAATATTLLADFAELTSSSLGRGVQPVTIELALDPDLEFSTENATAATEGYLLEINGGVKITARTDTGVYWGTRSLLQMLASSLTLPDGIAVDWPNYPVRGFMLDVGRRFARPEAVRDYIRMMSWFKINTFMIHLNDNEITKDTKRSKDSGWPRIHPGSRVWHPRTEPMTASSGIPSRTWQ